MSLVEYVRQFIGVPPVGFEYLEYGVSAVFFLLLISFVTDLLRVVSSYINFRR